MLYTIASIVCLTSAIITGCMVYFFEEKKYTKAKEELIMLKTKLDSNSSLQDIIKRDFVELANEIIKKEQEDLRKQNRESLEEKIQPLTKELSEFKQKVENFNLKGVENTTRIVEQILNLEKNNKIIAKEANNLVEALTKNQNIKGAYGEDLLDTILNSCGMSEGIHYHKQVVTKSENLKNEMIHTVRPDIVLNLPMNRHLIIDSKVTLTSYLDYIEDNKKIGEFKSEVKKRIVDLGQKNYHSASDLSQPDFVLLYMPIESSVNLIYEDLDIINLAYKSNVIIVGTASLLTTIRLVNQLFAQQKQVESVNNIVMAGTNLYETFVQFCDDLIDVQKRLSDANNKLNKTINRFSRGNKNKPSLFSQVNTLKEFGIISTKDIPAQLLIEDDNKQEINIEYDNAENEVIINA